MFYMFSYVPTILDVKQLATEDLPSQKRKGSSSNYHFAEATPLKTNMEPENGPLGKEIPLGNYHFQVPCWFLEV